MKKDHIRSKLNFGPSKLEGIRVTDWSPRVEETDEDRLSPKICQCNFLKIQIWEREIRRSVAG